MLILALISQYELLGMLAEYLSTLDLFNLAKSCSEIYAIIHRSNLVFQQLTRRSLCDGRGLRARQEFKWPYSVQAKWFTNQRYRNPWSYEEEIEVRVWNRECDATNALPCLKCGVNICEECRFVPRVRDMFGYMSRQRPYLDPGNNFRNMICYCHSCDEIVEQELPQRLSEYCTCDQYTRWICLPCKIKEDQPETRYHATRIKTETDYTLESEPVREKDGMWVQDDLSDVALWCPCGERSPRDVNIRCTWCFRRISQRGFRPQAWYIPEFDSNPCHPKYVDDRNIRESTYPRLRYRGPIAP